MDGHSGDGTADRVGAGVRRRRWPAVVLLLFLGLLGTWLVLGLFVLDVVVADAGNLAVVMVWFAVAAWSVRRRQGGHASMWTAAAFSIMTFFLFIHDPRHRAWLACGPAA